MAQHRRQVSASVLAEILLDSIYERRRASRVRKQDVSDFRVMACYFGSDDPFVLAVGKTRQQAESYAKAHKRHLQSHGPDLIGSPRWVNRTWFERWIDGEWVRL